MATTTVSYPFDPTGQAPSNRITGERQILTPPDWSDFYFILPEATPYFSESLTLIMRPSGKELVEGVDYNPSHRFYDATIQCASPVYGSITFLDKTLSGVIELDYQTLGGDWTINDQQAAQVLANTLLNPRTTTWEEVVDLPYQFPPVDHAWDIVDMIGAKEIVEKLDAIATALQESGDQGLATHLADFNNPHRVTAAQVGLGNVANYGIATVADAQAGISNAVYMTPSVTQQAIIQFAVTPLNAHIANTTNPHAVTKAQVGLGNVANYAVASTADAQAGVVTTSYMTPALTASAINQQALLPLGAHLADFNNPHQVTKTQIGLSNVPNYPMASTVEAQAGTATDRLMSPALVTAMMQTGLGGNLQAHIDDHNNPHVVTSTQVGLGNVANYPVATNAQALAGTDTASYMTPALTMATVTDQLLPFASHISDQNNPHVVTATQVGLGNVANYPVASTAQAQAGTDTATYMTPALTASAITTLALAPLDAHTTDTGNPHAVTAAQVGLGNVVNYPIAATADAQAGTDTASYMTPALTAAAIEAQVGGTLAGHVTDFNNPHQVTAAQVGAYSTAESDSNLTAGLATKLDATAMATNSALLQGMTVAQIVDSVPMPAPTAIARIEYPPLDPATDPLGITWTKLALGDTTLTNPAPLIFEVAGGEGRQDLLSPLYRVTLSVVDPTEYTVELLEGYDSTVIIGFENDPGNNVVNVWMKSKPLRNAVNLRILSDPGFGFAALPTVVDVEPSGIVYARAVDSSKKAKTSRAMSGAIPFGQPYGSTVATTAVEYDTLVQRINVVEPADTESTVQNLPTNWGQAAVNFPRMASYGNEAYRADSLLGWSWDSTNSLLAKNTSDAALATLLSEHTVAGGYQLEVLVDSTDLADMAIGIVGGFTDSYGQPKAIYALRDMGGFSSLAATPGAVPGGTFYKLFSVGYNLLQNDAVDLGSTSTGLTWGDGVADADRGTAGAYVPEATTTGTNGWNGKGKVAIRVTVVGTTMTFETSTYGAVAGSITYIAGATVTVDLTATTTPGLAELARAISQEGVRWGLCCFKQPTSRFAINAAPDQYQRYVKVQVDGVTGADTSLLNMYNGTTWVTYNLIDQLHVKPCRLYYSDANKRLYQCMRDGSLDAIELIAYTESGQQILTT